MSDDPKATALPVNIKQAITALIKSAYDCEIYWGDGSMKSEQEARKAMRTMHRHREALEVLIANAIAGRTA